MQVRSFPARSVIALGLLLLAACSAVQKSPEPGIKTESGRVTGLELYGVEEYLGIRYAAPPVGDLRWQPPQPPAPVQAVTENTHFRAHCPQAASYFGIASADEDCLFLNVYRPAKPPAGPMPVMVWIHGGALVVGESEDFDPSPLVRQGVVAVTINYRLGALGFLAHPALDAEGHGFANYGLMDQQAALRWVQRNIAAFGGDPKNVTIFGHSAGGWSTLANLASPPAAGLFQRAIAMSGAYAMTMPTLANGEAEGRKFATEAGCPDQSAACLRALPIATILAKEDQWPKPAIDGTFVTGAQPALFAAGKFTHVPVMLGTTHDEFRLFVFENNDVDAGEPLTKEGYPKAVASIIGAELGAKAIAEYPIAKYASADFAASAVLTDSFFACPGYGMAQALAGATPTWVYEFNDPIAPQDFLPKTDLPTGAAHGSELQFVMGVHSQPTTTKLDASEVKLSEAMIRYWTRFARNGDPNGPGDALWPAEQPGKEIIQGLNPPSPGTESGFLADHHCGFWASVAK
jgi:para-nitrobenzyl esterase